MTASPRGGPAPTGAPSSTGADESRRNEAAATGFYKLQARRPGEETDALPVGFGETQTRAGEGEAARLRGKAGLWLVDTTGNGECQNSMSTTAGGGDRTRRWRRQR